MSMQKRLEKIYELVDKVSSKKEPVKSRKKKRFKFKEFIKTSNNQILITLKHFVIRV